MGGARDAELVRRCREARSHLAPGTDGQADVRDADLAVAERGDVLGRGTDAPADVREHDVGGDPADFAVDEDERPPDRTQILADARILVVDEREHESVDSPRAQRLERDDLSLHLPAGAGDQEADALSTQLLLEHVGDPAEDVVADRGHEQSDEERSRGPEAARSGVDAIVEDPDRLKDAGTRLGRHVRRAVQDPRDRRLRNHRHPRDVEDRRLANAATSSRLVGI